MTFPPFKQLQSGPASSGPSASTGQAQSPARPETASVKATHRFLDLVPTPKRTTEDEKEGGKGSPGSSSSSSPTVLTSPCVRRGIRPSTSLPLFMSSGGSPSLPPSTARSGQPSTHATATAFVVSTSTPPPPDFPDPTPDPPFTTTMLNKSAFMQPGGSSGFKTQTPRVSEVAPSPAPVPARLSFVPSSSSCISLADKLKHYMEEHAPATQETGNSSGTLVSVAPKATGPKLTQPRSPQFHSRYREEGSSQRESVKSKWNSLRDKGTADQGGQFKANPVNVKVLQSSGDYGVPRIRRKEPTVPKSPAFSDRLRPGRIRDRARPMLVAPAARRGVGAGGPVRTGRPMGKKASPARVRRVMGLEQRYSRPTLSSRLKAHEVTSPLDHGSLAEKGKRRNPTIGAHSPLPPPLSAEPILTEQQPGGSSNKASALKRRLPRHIRSPRRIGPLTGGNKRPSPLSLSAPARRVCISQADAPTKDFSSSSSLHSSRR